jgi:hypothetical protein
VLARMQRLAPDEQAALKQPSVLPSGVQLRLASELLDDLGVLPAAERTGLAELRWWGQGNRARRSRDLAVVFKPSTTASPPLVDQLRGADCRARGGPHDRAHRLAPALVRDADHRCGREGLRVPEVGDSALVRSQPSREALESDLGDMQGVTAREASTWAACPGPWTCCSAAGHQRSCSRSTRTERRRCPIPSLLAHRLRRRRSAAQQTHTAFARVLKRLSRQGETSRIVCGCREPWLPPGPALNSTLLKR